MRTHTRTHTHKQKQFQENQHTPDRSRHLHGLKISLVLVNKIIITSNKCCKGLNTHFLFSHLQPFHLMYIKHMQLARKASIIKLSPKYTIGNILKYY